MQVLMDLGWSGYVKRLLGQNFDGSVTGIFNMSDGRIRNRPVRLREYLDILS